MVNGDDCGPVDRIANLDAVRRIAIWRERRESRGRCCLTLEVRGPSLELCPPLIGFMLLGGSLGPRLFSFFRLSIAASEAIRVSPLFPPQIAKCRGPIMFRHARRRAIFNARLMPNWPMCKQ